MCVSSTNADALIYLSFAQQSSRVAEPNTTHAVAILSQATSIDCVEKLAEMLELKIIFIISFVSQCLCVFGCHKYVIVQSDRRGSL